MTCRRRTDAPTGRWIGEGTGGSAPPPPRPPPRSAPLAESAGRFPRFSVKRTISSLPLPVLFYSERLRPGCLLRGRGGNVRHPEWSHPAVPGAVSKSSVCLTTQSAVKQPKDFLSLPGTERVDQEVPLQAPGRPRCVRSPRPVGALRAATSLLTSSIQRPTRLFATPCCSSSGTHRIRSRAEGFGRAGEACRGRSVRRPRGPRPCPCRGEGTRRLAPWGREGATTCGPTRPR